MFNVLSHFLPVGLYTCTRSVFYSRDQASTNQRRCSIRTFDVHEAVEEADGLEGEEVGQVLQAHLEGVPVIQLQVGVDRETQVLLDVLAQLVQQVLLMFVVEPRHKSMNEKEKGKET